MKKLIARFVLSIIGIGFLSTGAIALLVLGKSNWWMWYPFIFGILATVCLFVFIVIWAIKNS